MILSISFMFTFSTLPLGSRGRTGRLLHNSRGTDSGRSAHAAVLLGLLVLVDHLLVVHGRGRSGRGSGRRAEVHVVQVVEVGCRCGAAVGLITIGRGRLDDGSATDNGSGAG